MKPLFAAALLCFTAVTSYAGRVYRVKLNIKDTKDTTVFLCHYYGVSSLYKQDSIRLKNGVGEYSSSDSNFAGGIYTLFLPEQKASFDVLLNKGDDITITADAGHLPSKIDYKNSPENTRFKTYVEYLEQYGKDQKTLQEKLAKATTATDTARLREQAGELAKKLEDYRAGYALNYPGTLLSNIFNAMKLPEVPAGEHYLEDGKTKDSAFAYNYYKGHFWDGFNLKDDRLIYTPIYDARLDEYFTKLTVPVPDSVNKEADMLLARARGTRDVFKYTLWWLTKFSENSKVMGMDEVFVYLVEKYYMKGDAFWLTPEELQKYIDRARKIAPNVIGNVAPEIKLKSVVTGKEARLSEGVAPYTLLVFYSPDCGHCQHEMPLLDSLYTGLLKAKGVRMFTVSTESTKEKIQEFIKKNHMDEWTNTWDPEYKGNWRNMYDIYSTPTIYLLDKQKRIIAKRVDHSNIGKVIEMEEKRAADKNLKKK